MYKIIGSDGKEYGPITLQQLQQWRSEGRINSQTRVLGPGAAEWKTASDFPELGFGAATGSAIPPSGYAPQMAPAPGGKQQQGLAITSFVLGLLSPICFTFLTGIPAVICGHIAWSRARRNPAQYSGAGFAVAGLILGYVGILLTLMLPAMLLPALSRAKGRAQQINCSNNMKQLGLAFRTWELDNNDQFPFHVSAAKGGTMEFCLRDASGLDQNSFLHFRVMSNELSTPKILVCAADPSKQPANDFANLTTANVTYKVYTGKEINDTNSQQVLAVCPIHGTILRVDGSVQIKPHFRP
jgi:hypothetical protein